MQITQINDLRTINNMIRDKVRVARTARKLMRLRAESAYVYTLVHTPSWSSIVRGKKREFAKMAKNEYTKTAKLINRQLKKIGSTKRVDTILN